MSIVCKITPSRKSQTVMAPLRDPVINWNALCGLRAAEVISPEDEEEAIDDP
jgi:hypothetical protein